MYNIFFYPESVDNSHVYVYEYVCVCGDLFGITHPICYNTQEWRRAAGRRGFRILAQKNIHIYGRRWVLARVMGKIVRLDMILASRNPHTATTAFIRAELFASPITDSCTAERGYIMYCILYTNVHFACAGELNTQ